MSDASPECGAPRRPRRPRGAHLRALGERLHDVLSEGRQIQIDVDAWGVSLDVSKAMTYGLIVNELLTNALKYAFAPGAGDGGFIRVRLTEVAGRAHLASTRAP